MAKERPLSPAMERVVRLLGAGWRLWQLNSLDGGFSVSHEGAPGVRSPSSATIFALEDRGLVRSLERRFPTTDWKLTTNGRRVARQLIEVAK